MSASNSNPMTPPQAPELPHGIEGLESYPFDFSFLLYVLLALAILGLAFFFGEN